MTTNPYKYQDAWRQVDLERELNAVNELLTAKRNRYRELGTEITTLDEKRSAIVAELVSINAHNLPWAPENRKATPDAEEGQAEEPAG